MVSLKCLPCSILLLWHRTLLFGFALWRFGLCFYPGTSPVTLLVPHGFFGIVDSNLELSGKCGSFVDVHSVLWRLSAVVYTLILSSLLKLITHGPVSPLDSGVGMGGDWGFLDSCKADFGILRSTGIPVIQRAHSAVPLYLPSTETFLPVEQNSYHNGQTQNTEKNSLLLLQVSSLLENFKISGTYNSEHLDFDFRVYMWITSVICGLNRKYRS